MPAEINMTNRCSSVQLTALELFCGIGGFAAAVAGTGVRIVGALDQSPAALSVYRLNFPGHGASQVDLEKIDAAKLSGYGADLWWLSPPCQPYSVRGRGRDLDDPRARSLLAILKVVSQIKDHNLPKYMALENVAGFADSRARMELIALLGAHGYTCRERLLCPTELGVPSRRPRYYLVASRTGLGPSRPLIASSRPLNSFLDASPDEASHAELKVPTEVVNRFGDGFRILEPDDLTAYTTCFTAGYGKSLMHAGSYLRCPEGVRRFAPYEIARLLGFPETFRFPAAMALRKRWHLLGNSLSVTAVREVLGDLPACSPDNRQAGFLAGFLACQPGISP
jgi:site-specific DNA-cytosine methylase